MTDKADDVSNGEHWYERRWRNTPGGTRSIVSVVLYVVTGLGAVLIAATAHDVAKTVVWAVIGAVFLVLAGTLIATLVARSRRKP